MFGQITSHINSVHLSSFGRQMTDTEVYTFCVLLRIRETVAEMSPMVTTETNTHKHTRVSYAFVAKTTRLTLHRL